MCKRNSPNKDEVGMCKRLPADTIEGSAGCVRETPLKNEASKGCVRETPSIEMKPGRDVLQIKIKANMGV